MCGLKLAQLENAFHPRVHPLLSAHSSPAVSSISSSDLSGLSGLPASAQHTAHSPHARTGFGKSLYIKITINLYKRGSNYYLMIMRATCCTAHGTSGVLFQ